MTVTVIDLVWHILSILFYRWEHTYTYCVDACCTHATSFTQWNILLTPTLTEIEKSNIAVYGCWFIFIITTLCHVSCITLKIIDKKFGFYNSSELMLIYSLSSNLKVCQGMILLVCLQTRPLFHYFFYIFKCHKSYNNWWVRYWWYIACI